MTAAGQLLPYCSASFWGYQTHRLWALWVKRVSLGVVPAAACSAALRRLCPGLHTGPWGEQGDVPSLSWQTGC